MAYTTRIPRERTTLERTIVICDTMNRTDGLVQRRRVVNSGGNAGGLGQDGSNGELGAGHGNDKLSGQGSVDAECSSFSQKDLNCNPTNDEDSDKETRLTLMEEVLLLGLKDKEVCLHRAFKILDILSISEKIRTI